MDSEECSLLTRLVNTMLSISGIFCVDCGMAFAEVNDLIGVEASPHHQVSVSTLPCGICGECGVCTRRPKWLPLIRSVKQWSPVKSRHTYG